jgi:hypothetical protein
MTRFTGAAATSASTLPAIQYRYLVDVGITSGFVYACNGNQFLYALGNTYSPVGGLGGIEAVEEESDSSPRTVRAWLAAVSSQNFFEPLKEDMFNRQLIVRHGYLSATSPATFVSSPEVLWSGRINKVEIRFADVERGNFYEIEAETVLRKRAPASNFNRETLWTVLNQSGDTFCDYADKVTGFKSLWGQQPTEFYGSGGSTTTNAAGDSRANPGWRNVNKV